MRGGDPLGSTAVICADTVLLGGLTLLMHRLVEMPARRALRRRLA